MTNVMPPGPLAYEGSVLVPFVAKTFSPTTANYQFTVPTLWVNTALKTAWMLVAKPLNVATWLPLGSAAGTLIELTGNSGGAVMPDAGNINIVGDGTTIDIVGDPGSSTLTVSTIGSVPLTFDADSGSAQAISGILELSGGAGISTVASGNQVTFNLSTPITVPDGGTGVTSFTAHTVLLGEGTSSIATAGPGTNGTLLQGKGASADPAFTTATYPNTTTINQLLYSSATNTITGLTSADNGTLVTSSSGVPSILVGPGTTGNILNSNAAAAPSWTTATYPLTTTINDILYSTSSNVIGQLAASDSSVLTSSASGVPTWAPLTDGQIIIGSSSGAPIAASLTPGTGIVITPGHNTITIATTGGGGPGTTIQQVRKTSASSSSTGTACGNTTTPTTSNTSVLMSLAITPTSVTSTLIFKFNTIAAVQAGGMPVGLGLFLFNGNTFIAANETQITQQATNAYFDYFMTAGTTSPTTFTIRWAPTSALTVNTLINTALSAPLYGGGVNTQLTITEVVT